MLFTSYRALSEAESILKEHWSGTLLTQGSMPKNELLSLFRTESEPILLGTSSFWEGIDMKGEALKIVMIDRIPFIPPDDPIVQARESSLKQKGMNGFFHFQIPEATIALKQGVGRLIRSNDDTGVLVLCDPRFTTKRYGQTIINSLPPFKWVYSPEEAIKLLESKSETNLETKLGSDFNE